MNTQMIELYTDYLISSFGQTTATGLSALLNGDIWHYDHSIHRNVKGINILNCLYHISDVSIPIAYEIVTKPIWFSDVDTRKTKRKSTQTKNEMLRNMFDSACRNRVTFRYVLMDSWFTRKPSCCWLYERIS